MAYPGGMRWPSMPLYLAGDYPSQARTGEWLANHEGAARTLGGPVDLSAAGQTPALFSTSPESALSSRRKNTPNTSAGW